MSLKRIPDQALMLLSGGRRKHLVIVSIIAAFFFSLTLFSLNYRHEINEILPLCSVYGQQSHCRQKAAHEAAKNSTLGFGAIVMINLPERSDRRDAFTLAASVSGIEATYVLSAVHGQSVAEKARPHGKVRLDNAHMGSWRSHMDAVRWIVDNNYETALILEDDTDWDVNIKENMQALSEGFRNNPLVTSFPEESDLFPYGNDWDIIHFSASRVKPAPPPLDTLSHIYPDPVLAAEPPEKTPCPDKKGWGCYGELLDHLGVPKEGHRAILPSYESVGLPAFALTREGAQRLLYLLEWKSLDAGLDYSLRDHLMAGDLKGWTIVPPVFGHWVKNGVYDSDIKGGGHTNTTGDNEGGRSSLLRTPGVRAHFEDLLERENVWEKFNHRLTGLER